MARPRKTDGSVSAKELLVAAFLQMLEQMPYRKITVKALSARAGLNHNSFYYHFGNMEQLAQYALEVTIPKEIPSQVVPRFLSEGVVQLPFAPEEMEPLFQRVKLFAKKDSPELNPIIRAKIESMWLQAAGIPPDSLSAKDRTVVSFLSAGGVATMGAHPDLTLREFLGLVDGTMGSIVRMAISQLREKRQEGESFA